MPFGCTPTTSGTLSAQPGGCALVLQGNLRLYGDGDGGQGDQRTLRPLPAHGRGGLATWRASVRSKRGTAADQRPNSFSGSRRLVGVLRRRCTATPASIRGSVSALSGTAS